MNYSDMIKKAIEFFPLWSDIRKRTSKSIGGQLLQSQAESTNNINIAIQEYKDYYFLTKYKDKEDEVLAFAYVANVGLIEDFSNYTISYKGVSVILTFDIDEFYDKQDYCYYENGNLYFKLEFIEDSRDIVLQYDNDSYSYTLEKTHVWNVFDEYAVFVGLERQQNESNKMLMNRILYSTKYPGDGTAQGLKNSIIAELMTQINIKESDIIIENVSPSNLKKAYKKYNSLLDMLNAINKDCLKDKKWDLDKWEYGFKSISFLDNIWDDAVSEYQNGIGFDDDLKVIIADSEMTTNADIVMYDKSLIKLEKYVQDNNIKKDITFKLKKYEDVLNPLEARYNIKASEAIDITHEEIELSVFESNKKIETRKIEEIYKLGKDIKAIDNTKINDEKSYRLEFYTDNNHDLMKISKANVIYKHKITGEIIEVRNLINKAPGFSINAYGELINSSIKKSIKSVKNFNSCTGLLDGEKGIQLNTLYTEGTGAVNVSGLGLNVVNVNIDHQEVSIPKSLIKLDSYSFWNDDTVVFRNDIRERRLEIKTSANFISFDLLEGEADVFVKTSNEDMKRIKVKAPHSFCTNKTNIANDIEITILSNCKEQVKFSNFKYSNHDLKLELQYGDLIEDDNVYRLPNIAINNMIVKFTARTNTTPIIKSIFIGDDLKELKYKTSIIESNPNAERILDIKTNASMNMLTVNPVGDTIYTNNNYLPCVTYKAIKDDAWIRLNLDEYESINEVICKDANIHVIEESGKLYYDVVLKNGQTVSTVQINGLRNINSKSVTLEEMIKKYIPTFDISKDKIYASKTCKGLIVETKDIHNPVLTKVNIKSDIFKGIDVSRYKFTKIPLHLTTVFVNNTSEINNIETALEFNSIGFIAAGTRIYQAINEAKIYTEEVRGIKMLNNFSPIMNTSTLMYYELSKFESNRTYDVRFAGSSDKGSSFETLTNWCIGYKDIAIKTPIDLSNTENYIISEVEIKDNVLLSRYIDLKTSYKLANNDEIFTNKYMVIPDPGCEVLYERYSDKNNPNLIIQEEVMMEEDGFTKLSYSNIDDLLYIGYSTYEGNNEITIQEFKLLKDEGIILWTDQQLIDQTKKVYLRYTIKNPISILLDEDTLYKSIGYDINAYIEMDRIRLDNIKDGYRFDLRQIENYSKIDLIYTKCESNSFQSQSINDVLIFNKIATKDSLLVKTGYYYLNGREYYLFPSKDHIDLNYDKTIDLENVDIYGDQIKTFETTDNFVRNSEMLFRGINELYNYDTTLIDNKDISEVTPITSCDNFNSWNSFGCRLSLEPGLNELAIKFNNDIPNGYSYIEITDYLHSNEINYVSLWAEKSLSLYVGEEKRYLGLKIPHAININITNEIDYTNSEFREAMITKNEDTRYYLIAKGEGILDDILISRNSNISSSHTKNIDLLNLSIKETSKTGQRFKVDITNENIINKGASLTKDNYIKIFSNLYWGVSPIKVYETKEDFAECSTWNVNIENNYIHTDKKEGYIETAPIFIDNPMAIKSMVFKINDIPFDDMRGMKTQILTSNSRNGEYIPVNIFNENYGNIYGDVLLKYIKVKISMPPEKFINNFGIYVEYISTDTNYPKLNMPSSGEMITKVYDTYFSNNYKIKEINVDDISNINDIEIYVQSSRDKYSADVWMPWKKIELDSSLNIKNDLVFDNTRFFRFKVLLKTTKAYIKIKNIFIEVI